MLLPQIERYIELLANEGHRIEIVTNMLVTKKLNAILALGGEILSKVEFKCSLHYLQLKERGLLDSFAANVKSAWRAGASCSIEVTPSDELVPYLDELKEYSLMNFGALPHLTIARNDRTENIERLTRYSVEEYNSIWSAFDSKLWDFKTEIFGVKQGDFCYAGSWSYYVNMATGDAMQCYCGKSVGNIFSHPERPLPEMPIGKCSLPHCYNGHSLLTMGDIPGYTDLGYGDVRDRVKSDGGTWLNPEMKDFFNGRLSDFNEELSDQEKRDVLTKQKLYLVGQKMKSLAKRVVGK